MAYLALYRKYRPQSFDEIVGQKAVVTALRNQVKYGQLGHAYLFCGTRGTGKTSVARVFAKAVNCLNPSEGSPCNECELCRDASSGFNIVEIDAASNNGVENIRDLRDEVVYTPVKGRFKVYIIDEVHMLSPQAFNALLKTLEEPPEHVIFILATTEPQKVMATILSRCQRYDFKRLNVDEIRGRLAYVCAQEGIEADSEALAYIAASADGGMRDALSLLDQCRAYYIRERITLGRVLEVLGAVDGRVLADMSDALARGSSLELLQGVDRVFLDGRDPLQFVLSWNNYLRGVLLYRVLGKDADTYVTDAEEVRARMADQANRLSREQLVFYIQELSKLANSLRFAQQRRVILETALISMAAGRASGGGQEALSARLDRLEERLERELRGGPRVQGAPSASAAPAKEELRISREPAPAFTPSAPKSAPQNTAPGPSEAAPQSSAKSAPGSASAGPAGNASTYVDASGKIIWSRMKELIMSKYPPLNIMSGMTMEEGEDGWVIIRGEPMAISFIPGKNESNLRWMESLILQETGQSLRVRTAPVTQEEKGKTMQEIMGSFSASVDWK